MTVNEMVSLCRSRGKTKEEYIIIRNLVYQEYDSCTKEEQEVLSDVLEELEMLIEWME
ncbi:MAG: hypothetical protein IJO97_06385 [Lachnospiraceae bacterium]|nr:hypothetical protein [Lachnospiraceae bacterium]